MTEHQRLDAEIAAMEENIAKKQIDKEKKTPAVDKSDQSGASKEEGGGVVTTTVIDGKPDWEEGDKTSEIPPEQRVAEEGKDTTGEGK